MNYFSELLRTPMRDLSIMDAIVITAVLILTYVIVAFLVDWISSKRRKRKQAEELHNAMRNRITKFRR
jgi:preprotein translocase subunit YajC